MRSSLLLAALALPVSLFAQPPAPPPGAPDAAAVERHRADTANDFAIVLGLKPAQRPALDAWLAARMPPPPPGAEPRPEASTTPERLQAKQAHLAERQRHEEAEIAATRRFYASLDPRQQQVFDALGRLRREGRHGWHGGRGGHRPDDRGPGGRGPGPQPPRAQD
jgi:hypothetical protein